jgi:hypothetical protein
MIGRAIRLVAVVTSLLVLISYGLFAFDQATGALHRQEREIDQGDAHGTGPLPQPRRHGQPRRFVDGAARTLLSPFTGWVTSKDPWVRRSIPTAIALLLYGFGLGFLARYARGLP